MTLIDDQMRAGRLARTRIVAVLCVLMLACAVIATGIGPIFVSPAVVAKVIMHHLGLPIEVDWARSTDTIVWIARMPRVIMACAVGSILAICGATLQAMVRNPLADPYILGINSGASTGAAFAILTPMAAIGGTIALSGFAFLGAMLATILVLFLGGNSRLSPYRLILAGMAVGYALNSVTSFLIFASDTPEAARSVLFWLMGSLAAISWSTAVLTIIIAAVICVGLSFIGPVLDALAEGDDASLALGIEPIRTRFILLIIVALAIGVAVAGAGTIGFVGLVVPHLARGLVGHSHRFLLPASALLGAAFLTLADIAARTLFAPREMALGVVTGVIGGPLLLILMKHRARNDA